MFTLEEMYDWDLATSRLAQQAPWWEPGTASGYHALNQGHLVGEVIRRVDGRGLKEFVRDEVAGPLGAHFQIGCVPADYDRVAPVIPPPALDIDVEAMDPESVAIKTLTGPMADAEAANTASWRGATIGAANGHGNARSVVDIQSQVAAGGGKLLSADTIDLIFQEQANGIDLVLGVPIRFGIGYGLPDPVTIPFLADGRVCFWGGWGGSVIIVDCDRKLTIAYMMNKMGAGIIGSERATQYVTATYLARPAWSFPA